MEAAENDDVFDVVVVDIFVGISMTMTMTTMAMIETCHIVVDNHRIVVVVEVVE